MRRSRGFHGALVTGTTEGGGAGARPVSAGRSATGPATNIATGPRPRIGTFRAGSGKTTFTIRQLTPAEVAKVAASAQVKGVSLDMNKDVYQVGNEKTYVQGSDMQDAADQVVEQLESGNVSESRIASGFFSRKILGIPVWAWMGGGVAAVGGTVFLMRRNRRG